MFLSFDTSKSPYCSFFNVCHCIVIHCLATKHSCTASSHSTGTPSYIFIITAYSHTAQTFCSTIIHCSHTAQSHCAQPCIFIIRAYSHTQLGHSGVIQHHYTVQSYSTFRQPGSHTAHTYTYHSHNEKSYNPSIMQSYGTESHHAAHSPVTQSHAACHTKKSKGGSKCVTAS